MFIGLYKTGSTWSWSSGEPVTYTAWRPGTPDNFGGNQNFVHLSTGYGQWDDVADAFYGAATQAIVEYIPQSSTFAVPANSSTGTQFIVPAGATNCTFNASGTWMNSTSNYTPAGDTNTMPSQWPSYYTWPMSTSPFFSLIALKSGAPFYIGSQATLSVTSGQSVSFVANDSYYSTSFTDNSGALSVSYNCSNTPVNAGSITVAANTIPGGTFQVPSGATSCQLSATGTWAAGPNAPLSSQTADGAVGSNALDLASRGAPLPSAAVGALVVRHSSNSLWELVGSAKTIPVASLENLTFMMNDATDSGYTDGNTGSLSVNYSCN
jgi:hypothetical protein